MYLYVCTSYSIGAAGASGAAGAAEAAGAAGAAGRASAAAAAVRAAEVVLPQVANTQWHIHCKSVIASLELIALLRKTNSPGCVEPDDLMSAIKGHLDLFAKAYGANSFRPKHHYVLHLPAMLLFWGVLLCTFTLERKHRALKRYACARKNLKKYESHVLEDLAQHNIWELCQKHWRAFSSANPTKIQLTELRHIYPSAFKLTLHNSIYGLTFITRGDAVSYTNKGKTLIGQLLLCVGIDFGDRVSMDCWVSEWSVDRSAATVSGFLNMNCTDTVAIVPASGLLEPLIYRMAGDESTSVVAVPYGFKVDA